MILVGSTLFGNELGLVPTRVGSPVSAAMVGEKAGAGVSTVVSASPGLGVVPASEGAGVVVIAVGAEAGISVMTGPIVFALGLGVMPSDGSPVSGTMVGEGTGV